MTESNSPHVEPFPAGLLRWSGHRDGGVKKPFRKGSGRPAGRQFTTPLIARIHGWVEDLVERSKTAPRVILLVGGPGNGKTDAVESCIEQLDEILKTGTAIFDAFESQFAVHGDEVLPRKVSVDLGKISSVIPDHLRQPLVIVQDATEKDPSRPHVSAEELFLKELRDVAEPTLASIYICCVNRGILAHALTIAHDHHGGERVLDLLNRVTEAVAVGPDSPSCWPLKGFEHVAVWPMDVESLAATIPGLNQPTVAHQVFEAALDNKRWTTCDASSGRCPFCENLKLLTRPESIDQIVRYLRFYESAAAKRWTFRELFSLVSYLIVGDDDLVMEGKSYSPCEWAQRQVENSKSSSQSRKAMAGRAPFALCSRLFHHRLFPRWPRLSTGRIRESRTLLQRNDLGEGGQFARDLFSWLDRVGQTKAPIGDDVQCILRGSLGDLLDPAIADPGRVLYEKDREKVTVHDVEEAFSLSVSDGLDLVGPRLHPLERDVLKRLAKADESLFEENVPRTRVRDAQLLQSAIRQFSSRLVKRSLGVRYGACKDENLFIAYGKALVDSGELREVRRKLQDLLRDEHRSHLSLVTTFGQPNSHRSRRVVLASEEIRVKDITNVHNASRPALPTPFLKIDKRLVPVTFQLFKAMRDASAGLHPDCLGEEIFALLDGVRSLVAGERVRDEDALDDAEILIGEENSIIEYREGQFFARGI